MATKTLKKMTAAKKRVAIANDVIDQLRSGMCNATLGTLLMPFLNGRKNSFAPANTNPGTDLRSLLKAKMTRCDACAKGAMFIAHVMRFDKIKIGPSDYILHSFDYGDDGVLSYFSEDQMDEIEKQFEGWQDGFAQSFPDPTERLIAIMENIIAHKGTFVV